MRRGLACAVCGGVWALAQLGAQPLPTDAMQSPILAGGGGYRVRRPEMYRAGWIDLNKNGQMDPYEDPTRPAAERVADLVSRLTLAEKIGQLEQQKLQPEVDRRDAALLAAGGLGSYLGAGSDADLRNRLQRVAVEESRLGIPLIFGFDTIHGFNTIFPIPLAQSCSWDPDLIRRTSEVAAAESAAVGVDWVFAPMVDVARDPRWGRIAEGAGEDPWLGGLMAAAAVNGFQGGDYGAPGRVAACLKHFVGYGAAEGGRDYNAAEIGLPTLRNVYLPPFRAGVEAGAATVMSAFNTLNGVPASANPFTLTEVLRSEWGFSGFVVSDWNAVVELIHHGFAADRRQAAGLALKAGVDMEMLSDCYRTELPASCAQGRVSPAELDLAVTRILRVKFAKGLFDRPYAAGGEGRPVDPRLAREAVAKSCVLLKNSGVLPLAGTVRSVALIGPLADDAPAMIGTWPAHGRSEQVITLRQALATALPAAQIRFAAGCGITEPGSAALAEAVAAARQSELVILAVGEPARWSGENKFRADLGLPAGQQTLFDRVAAIGKPVVTVVFAGRPLAIPEVLDRSQAVLLAWHPGLQAGPGICDLLTGRIDPTGRLTATLPRFVGQVPIYYNHTATGRPLADYRDLTREPLRPFGFGLTYTTFRYGPTRLSGELRGGGKLIATAALANVGGRSGTEVVQLYLHARSNSTGVRPVRELKGFRRVALAAGEKTEVSFELSAPDLGWWSEDGRWLVEPGAYEVVIAPNAAAGQMAPFRLD